MFKKRLQKQHIKFKVCYLFFFIYYIICLYVYLEKAAELTHDAQEKAKEIAHATQGRILVFFYN